MYVLKQILFCSYIVAVKQFYGNQEALLKLAFDSFIHNKYKI